ncbi:MAG: enoyl-CoA hydratase [Minwuia thermotolerans]|nr:MAG: enoyl-CoA hydratase [Minwuia thermotolerans]
MTDLVHYSLADGIATLRMDDGKANAFSHAMMQALSAALDRAAEEASITVIRGRDGVLCGGFDLKVIRGDPADVPALVTAGQELLMKTWLHPQPLLIGVTGHAVAAGALLVLTADYRIGVDGDFRIGLNETAIGLSLPDFAIALTEARLDRRALTMATIGAQLYSPEKAVEVGYLDQVAVPGNFEDALAEAAESMRKLDPDGVADVKRRLRGAAADRILATVIT